MEKLITWVEIPTTDFERGLKFYNQLLGLNMKGLDFGTEKMACLPNDEGAIIYADGFKPSEQGCIVSFNVGDKLDDCLNKIESWGGKVLKPKTKIEAEGRDFFSLIIDSEGNRMGLYGK